MQKFRIEVRSFSDIQDFVSLATVQPFDISVGNDYQQVSAKSFMGMISLDYSKPIFVTPKCDEKACATFRQDAAPFLAEI